MHLKLPANLFLVIEERERENICVNLKCISFAGMCDVELSKMLDDCETLVSVLSLPVGESNFGRSFVSLSVAPHSDSSFLSRYFSSMLQCCK